jgi:signal transduction histidine kinase
MNLGRIFRGVAFRIWLPFAVALSISILALGVYYPRVQENLFLRVTEQKFTELARATALSVELSIDRDAFASLAKSIEVTTKSNSFAFVAIVQRMSDGTEQIFAVNPPETPAPVVLRRDGRGLLYTSAPFNTPDLKGSVILAASEEKLSEDIRTLNLPVYRTLGVILVLSLFVVALLARALSHPIKTLTGFASQLRTGHYSVATPSRPYATELKELQDTLVELRDSLSAARLGNDEINRKLVVARDAARDADRAKSAFVANMSHEIRTPLNAVLGLAHLALQTDLPPKQRDYLLKISRSGRTLAGIVNDILDFSKIEAGALELESIPFSLGEVLEQVDAITGEAAREKGISFSITGTDHAKTLFLGDPLRIQQVLVNFTGNAVKFTHQGGVRIGIERRESSAETVSLAFRVCDTGVGLTPAQMEKLFRSFSQADVSTTRTYGGTGLGLVISRRLAEAMGGTITVESVAGQGSVFTFTTRLRLSVEGASVRGSSPPAEHRARLQGRRLLVAEDNEFNQEIVRELLERSGAKVVIAGNGAEALQTLERDPAFDLVLMDVQMPVMDGFEAARRIRQQPALARLTVIAMTANVTVEDRKRCREAGMNDFVGKPIVPDRLFEVAARCLAPAPSGAS